MEEWKQRLYSSYVSTGQASLRDVKANFSHNPYFEYIIKKHLDESYNSKILDLACGHGLLIYCLKNSGYKNVTGIDISEEQIELAHELGIHEAKCEEIDTFLLKNEKFDVIFLMDVLEHLEKDQTIKILDYIYNSLNKNGKLIIHIPNAEGIFGMRIRYGDFTHITAFTSRSIHQILSACRFTEINCHEDKPLTHNIKGYIRKFIWDLLTLPHRLLLIVETGSYKHILSQNILVIAHKKTNNT